MTLNKGNQRIHKQFFSSSSTDSAFEVGGMGRLDEMFFEEYLEGPHFPFLVEPDEQTTDKGNQGDGYGKEVSPFSPERMFSLKRELQEVKKKKVIIAIRSYLKSR